MKKITARVGSYEKDGQTKGRFEEIGVIGVSQNQKEYVLINPTVDLAGVLLLQNIEAAKEGKQPSERIICSVFDNDNQASAQGGGYGSQAPQQAPQQQAPQQRPQQNNQAAPSSYANVPHAQQQQAPGPDPFDDGIPFY